MLEEFGVEPDLAIRTGNTFGRTPIGIEEIRVHGYGEIDGEETAGERAFGRFDVAAGVEVIVLRGFARCDAACAVDFFSADRCEAVVGRDENIGLRFDGR